MYVGAVPPFQACLLGGGSKILSSTEIIHAWYMREFVQIDK